MLSQHLISVDSRFAHVLKEKVIEVIILLLDYLTANETCSGNNK